MGAHPNRFTPSKWPALMPVLRVVFHREARSQFWEHIKSRHGNDKEVLPSQKPVRCRTPDCPDSFTRVLLMAIHIIIAPKHQLLCAVPFEVFSGTSTQVEYFQSSNSQHPGRITQSQHQGSARETIHRNPALPNPFWSLRAAGHTKESNASLGLRHRLEAQVPQQGGSSGISSEQEGGTSERDLKRRH
jgi:hypothetical protein